MRHSVTLAFTRASSRFNDGVALKHESRKVRAAVEMSDSGLYKGKESLVSAKKHMAPLQ